MRVPVAARCRCRPRRTRTGEGERPRTLFRRAFDLERDGGIPVRQCADLGVRKVFRDFVHDIVPALAASEGLELRVDIDVGLAGQVRRIEKLRYAVRTMAGDAGLRRGLGADTVRQDGDRRVASLS